MTEPAYEIDATGQKKYRRGTCDFCKSRKVSCTGDGITKLNCQRCQATGRPCTWSFAANRPPTEKSGKIFRRPGGKKKESTAEPSAGAAPTGRARENSFVKADSDGLSDEGAESSDLSELSDMDAETEQQRKRNRRDSGSRRKIQQAPAKRPAALPQNGEASSSKSSKENSRARGHAEPNNDRLEDLSRPEASSSKRSSASTPKSRPTPPQTERPRRQAPAPHRVPAEVIVAAKLAAGTNSPHATDFFGPAPVPTGRVTPLAAKGDKGKAKEVAEHNGGEKRLGETSGIKLKVKIPSPAQNGETEVGRGGDQVKRKRRVDEDGSESKRPRLGAPDGNSKEGRKVSDDAKRRKDGTDRSAKGSIDEKVEDAPPLQQGEPTTSSKDETEHPEGKRMRKPSKRDTNFLYSEGEEQSQRKEGGAVRRRRKNVVHDDSEDETGDDASPAAKGEEAAETRQQKESKLQSKQAIPRAAAEGADLVAEQQPGAIKKETTGDSSATPAEAAPATPASKAAESGNESLPSTGVTKIKAPRPSSSVASTPSGKPGAPGPARKPLPTGLPRKPVAAPKPFDPFAETMARMSGTMSGSATPSAKTKSEETKNAAPKFRAAEKEEMNRRRNELYAAHPAFNLMLANNAISRFEYETRRGSSLPLPNLSAGSHRQPVHVYNNVKSAESLRIMDGLLLLRDKEGWLKT